MGLTGHGAQNNVEDERKPDLAFGKVYFVIGDLTIVKFVISTKNYLKPDRIITVNGSIYTPSQLVLYLRTNLVPDPPMQRAS